MQSAVTMTPFVLLLLLSSVCSQTAPPLLQDLTGRTSDFAARLYRAVASRYDENVFMSPFTLTAGLMALLSGARGPTQDQLLQGLSLTGLDPQNLPDLFQTLRTTILQGDRTMSLRQGMAILPAHTFAVSSSYQDLVQTKFSGNVISSLVYTTPDEAVDTINRWAQEQAGDQVKELVTHLDPQTQLLIATVASYQTQFSPSFNVSQSQEERFYVDKYHVVMVTMMFRTDKYFLAYDHAVKAGVLKLPMMGGMAMLVVLPDENVDVTTVEEEVTGEKIRAWIRQLKKTKLEVQLPRFLLERSYSLKDVLQTLDITQVFQDDADLMDTGTVKGPRLAQVFHKSVISVNESNDDISAEGGVSMFSSLPPRLIINRPFVFIIYEQTTGSLLFMGRVVDPTKN